MRPAVMPPESDGLPAAAACHATGAVLVGFKAALIGYVSFDVAVSLSIGTVELPAVALRAA